MMTQLIEISIDILGKTYRLKCPALEVNALQQAAKELEAKMQSLRQNGLLSLDSIAVITALNAMHQLSMAESRLQQHVETLCHKIDEKINVYKEEGIAAE